jgi:hypothetical protein
VYQPICADRIHGALGAYDRERPPEDGGTPELQGCYLESIKSGEPKISGLTRLWPSVGCE